MAETNLNVMNDFGEINSIDFINRFSTSIYDLLEFLGVTRQMPLSRDMKIKTYKWSTDINQTNVGEGEEIPLSKVTRIPDKEFQVEWFKKRRSVTAEAVARHGRDVAIIQADNRLMNGLQYDIETDFTGFLKAKPTKLNAENLQQALAKAWGKLYTFNEFRGAPRVGFVNPEDVADFLGATPVGADASNVMGMTLLKNFLGVERVVIMNSVPKGKVYATVDDNLVFAYLDVRNSDLATEFVDYADPLGFIGVSRDRVLQRLTADTVYFGANELFAEVPEGVVEVTIKASTTPAA